MVTPAEARARYAAAVQVSPCGTEAVPVEEAVGRVLAADVLARTDLPPFTRSLVDGWAVRSEEVSGATPEAPVRLRRGGEVSMGRPPEVQVTPGTAVRIPTGGMLPAGADAVVMQEHAREEAVGVLLQRAVRSGENTVAQGADITAGQVVLTRGRRLRPSDLGLLAAEGWTAVPVYLRPRVALFVTGDEVVPSGRMLAPGQVRDSNSAALAGAVREAGGVPAVLGIVEDDRQAVEAALRGAIAGHDMVLVSGGSSVGDRDVVAEAISSLGPPGVIVHGIAVRPGKPTVLGAAGSVPVIGLPGNPVSALVIFDLFARPVIEAMQGVDPDAGPWRLVRARLTAPLIAPPEREDHRRVRLEAAPDGIRAAPLPAGSQILTSMARADGMVVVPAGGRYEVDDEVEVRLL